MTTILEFAAKEPFIVFIALFAIYFLCTRILETIEILFRGYPPESTITTTETETTKTTLD